MTLEQRLDQLEQQNQKMQRTNKRLTTALTMTVVAMCATMSYGYQSGQHTQQEDMPCLT